MGLERKSKVIREEDRKTTAYHEGGHALVARMLPNTDAVGKVTIIPRGRAAGVTWFLPDESDFSYKDQLESRLAVSMGGRVAEEIIFNRISTGASNDIKQATSIAHKMVCDWGMSDKMGPLSYSSSDDQIFIGRELGHRKSFSEETAKQIDAEVARFVNDSYTSARQILTDNIEILHKIADELLDKETISGKELDEIILALKPDATLVPFDTGEDFAAKDAGESEKETPDPEKDEGENA
jgi:cell division protease FtsH